MVFNPEIPQAKVPVVDQSGALTKPWRLWLQTLGGAASAVTGAVSSFNGRVGAVLLSFSDVIAALGFTPGQGTVTVTGAPALGAAAVFTGPATIGPGASGITPTVNANVAVSPGKLLSFVSGGAILADATDATKPACAVALQAVGAGFQTQIALPGQIVTAITGLTPGAPYFLSTAGTITATVPTTGANQFVGYGTPAGNLLFQPGPDQAL